MEARKQQVHWHEDWAHPHDYDHVVLKINGNTKHPQKYLRVLLGILCSYNTQKNKLYT